MTRTLDPERSRPMPNWNELEETLTSHLNLDRAPVAITFCEAPLAPDVVIVACRASAVMYLGEAARSVGAASAMPPLLRPTCMAIPAAAAHGATMSLGCIGNRVYTGSRTIAST